MIHLLLRHPVVQFIQERKDKYQFLALYLPPLLRYNSYIIHFTHRKYTIEWFFQCTHKSCASILEIFITQRRNPLYIFCSMGGITISLRNLLFFSSKWYFKITTWTLGILIVTMLDLFLGIFNGQLGNIVQSICIHCTHQYSKCLFIYMLNICYQTLFYIYFKYIFKVLQEFILIQNIIFQLTSCVLHLCDFSFTPEILVLKNVG